MSAPFNPPAFPLALPAGFESAEAGMTLRDWFAGQALAATMARGFEAAALGKQSPIQWAADISYRLADAMLAARQDATS